MPLCSRMNRTFASVLIGGLLLCSTAAPAADWPQFRGPDRNGHTPDTGLLASWPEEGPPELWRHPLGEGYSAVTVVGDRLYTLFAEPPASSPEDATEAEGEPAEGAGGADDAGTPAREFAAAFDAASGRELWRTAVDQRIETSFGNGPRSSPTVVGGRVYVLGSHGKIAALEAADGKMVWQVDALESLGGRLHNWGFSSSILVDGERAILELGLPEGKTYAAFAITDGELLWTTGDSAGAGYNSPQIIEIHGHRHLLYLVAGQLRGIDFDGNELWSHPWPDGESHAMPIFIAPDMVYASGAEGVGAAVVRITAEGEGFAIEELWSGNQMRNHFSSSLFHEGHIYGFDNATLKCIEAATGTLKWAKRGLGKGSLIYGEGHLYVLSDRGRLLMARATPEGWQETGQIQALTGRTWTAPSIADGRLYLRSHEEMVAYDLRAQKEDS